MSKCLKSSAFPFLTPLKLLLFCSPLKVSSKKQLQSETLRIQVSLAIRGGYVPGKSSIENTKTAILSFK